MKQRLQAVTSGVLIGLAAFALAAATQAGAAPSKASVLFAVADVRSDHGTLKAVLCTQDEQFPADCKLRAAVAATKGLVTVAFTDVPPGRYALALFHDENDNGRIDMRNPAVPAEGLAFGRNAMGARGVPTFAQAAMDVASDTRSVIKMRYFQ